MTDRVHIVLAADSNYHMQLSVVVASICGHFDFENASLSLHIFFTNFTKQQIRRIEGEAENFEVEFVWHAIDTTRIDDAPVHGHVSLATYFRILAFGVLCDDLERVLYLDSDIVVCTDLSQLWGIDIPQGCTIGAVQDCTCYQFRTDMVRARSRLSGEVVYEASGIPISEWGIPPDAPYFNAGVLLVNLNSWQSEELTDRALRILQQARAQLTYWDQDVLNALLWNRWHPLPLRWNVTPCLMAGQRKSLIYSSADIEASLGSPGILHYATHRKPWICGYKGPWADEWENALASSSWAGWKPRLLPHLSHVFRGFIRTFFEGVRWHATR